MELCCLCVVAWTSTAPCAPSVLSCAALCCAVFNASLGSFCPQYAQLHTIKPLFSVPFSALGGFCLLWCVRCAAHPTRIEAWTQPPQATAAHEGMAVVGLPWCLCKRGAGVACTSHAATASEPLLGLHKCASCVGLWLRPCQGPSSLCRLPGPGSRRPLPRAVAAGGGWQCPGRRVFTHRWG